MADSLLTLNNLDIMISKAYDVGRAAWEARPNLLSRFTTEDTTDDESINYPFIFPTVEADMLEIGEEVGFDDLIGKYVNIKLKKFGKGVEVRRIDIAKASRREMYLKQAKALPQILDQRIERRMFDAFNDGDSDAYWTVYDGQQLYSVAHSVGYAGSSWSNLITGTGTTTAAIEADIQSMINQFSRIPWGPLKEDGTQQFMPIDGARFVVFAPPELQPQFDEITSNTLKPISGFNTENYYRGLVDPLYDNRLTDKTDWIMVLELPGASAFVRLRHSTESARTLYSDVTPGGAAHLKDKSRWWVQTLEEIFPNQFWLQGKIVNSGS